MTLLTLSTNFFHQLYIFFFLNTTYTILRSLIYYHELVQFISKSLVVYREAQGFYHFAYLCDLWWCYDFFSVISSLQMLWTYSTIQWVIRGREEEANGLTPQRCVCFSAVPSFQKLPTDWQGEERLPFLPPPPPLPRLPSVPTRTNPQWRPKSLRWCHQQPATCHEDKVNYVSGGQVLRLREQPKGN